MDGLGPLDLPGRIVWDGRWPTSAAQRRRSGPPVAPEVPGPAGGAAGGVSSFPRAPVGEDGSHPDRATRARPRGSGRGPPGRGPGDEAPRDSSLRPLSVVRCPLRLGIAGCLRGPTGKAGLRRITLAVRLRTTDHGPRTTDHGSRLVEGRGCDTVLF